MRIGIVAFLHESNTFSRQPTTLELFKQDLLLKGDAIRLTFVDAYHEVGGFFAGLAAAGAEAVPILAARALPSGTIQTTAFDEIVGQILSQTQEQGPLDGLLIAPHGAAVSQHHSDADGYWISALRSLVGPLLPIIGTLDAHANLSPKIVAGCDALVAYRTNPHVDQRERGVEAAKLLVRTIREEIHPVMSAVFPPLAISIDRQCTEEKHLRPLYEAADAQLRIEGVLSNSILLGFPYADVHEMGSAVIVVTDGKKQLADQLAIELASTMWSERNNFRGEFTSVSDALLQCERATGPVCLLDMGDNVGGGSAADGTQLLSAIHARGIRPAFGCVFDPKAVAACQASGVDSHLRISVGGKTDDLHGEPIDLTLDVKSLHVGRFREPNPRHGGITQFDQGPTAICETVNGLTLMLTSRRMVPFSLQQLVSCGLDPTRFRVLVAKGVNAPLAAYRSICDTFIRVNTTGSTCADMTRLPYRFRRQSMFPFDPEAAFQTAPLR